MMPIVVFFYLTGQDTELETVKKGTPLYGQPSWWGEEDADDYKYPHTSTLTEKDKISSMYTIVCVCVCGGGVSLLGLNALEHNLLLNSNHL